MATRSKVKIDGINLYSHYDGYEFGMACKLYSTIEKLTTIETYINYNEKKDLNINKNRFLNSFIAGNIGNCEVDINESIGGLEFAYYINSKDMTIKAYSIDYETEKEVLFFSGSIIEYIQEYQFHEGKSFLSKCQNIYETRIKNEYQQNEIVDLYTEQQRKRLIKYYWDYGQTFTENNPNRRGYLNKSIDLKNARKINKGH